MSTGRNLRQVGDRVETLIGEIHEIADEPTRARAEELVGLLVDLYGAGLERIAEILSEDGAQGQRLLAELADDRFVASLLVLHSLHPVDVDDRIQQALEQVRPYLGSHAGGVDYLGVDDEGIVHLKLEGSCEGCASSAVTVELAIERAIQEAAPEVTGIAVEGVPQAEPVPALIQIQPLRNGQPTEEGPAAGDGWMVLEDDLALSPGTIRATEVGGAAVLLANVQGSMLAYLDACGACRAPLSAGELEGEQLRCPACEESFDVRLAGRGVDTSEVHLQPLPLLERDGRWHVAMPVGAHA